MKAEWDFEQLYFKGDEYFADLLSALEQAKSSVEMETYIFRADPMGKRVERALAQAASRGVKVRLLVDGIGASGWLDRASNELKNSGAFVRVYHPILWRKSLYRLLRGLPFLTSQDPQRSSWVSRLNRRNHRKVCIVDSKQAWVGSLNISSSHCESLSGDQTWRDTGVSVKGSGIQDLSAAFDHAWLRSTSLDGKRRWRDTFIAGLWKARSNSPLVRLNYTARLRRRHYFELAGRLKHAKTRIWITNAYLAPSAPMIRHLSTAARRGVDVRLMVPQTSDVFFMPWVTSLHYQPLLQSGVKIYEYLPRFLHAKSLIIDNWAVTGTSNMNRRSMLFDFEVDIVLSKKESLHELEAQFAKDLLESEEIFAAKKGVKSLLGRIFAYLFRELI